MHPRRDSEKRQQLSGMARRVQALSAAGRSGELTASVIAWESAARASGWDGEPESAAAAVVALAANAPETASAIAAGKNIARANGRLSSCVP